MTIMNLQHTNFMIRTHDMTKNIIIHFEANIEHEFGLFSILGFYFFLLRAIAALVGFSDRALLAPVP